MTVMRNAGGIRSGMSLHEKKTTDLRVPGEPAGGRGGNTTPADGGSGQSGRFGPGAHPGHTTWPTGSHPLQRSDPTLFATIRYGNRPTSSSPTAE